MTEEQQELSENPNPLDALIDEYRYHARQLMRELNATVITPEEWAVRRTALTRLYLEQFKELEL